MSREQRLAVERIVSGPRGSLIGPFIPMLRSPELMNRAQLLGEYLRYQSSVPLVLREFAILICARIWQQTFEWHTHAPLAAAAGLPPQVIEDLARNTDLGDLAGDQAVVYSFCNELHRNKSVSDATYASALQLLGENGVVDLCGICGYYTMLAMVMNVARTPVPGDPELPFTIPGAA